MSIYPNFETTLPAYKAIKKIQENMPEFEIVKIKVKYTSYQEYLEIEVVNKDEYDKLISLLYASGEFIEKSKNQKIMNLGAFELPIDEFGAPSSSPCCYVSENGSFVIVDLNTMQMINYNDLQQYPLDQDHSFFTHIHDFIDAVGVMNNLSKVMSIDNLRIIEISNGEII